MEKITRQKHDQILRDVNPESADYERGYFFLAYIEGDIKKARFNLVGTKWVFEGQVIEGK